MMPYIGAFGKVYSGSMITDDVLRIGTKVAIKTMKGRLLQFFVNLIQYRGFLYVEVHSE